MKTKKLSKQIYNKIIQKYHSGEGCKEISKALNISRSTVRTIIQKWKEYSLAVNLPTAGCHQEQGVCAKKVLLKETTTESVGTVEEMQSWRLERNLWKNRKTFHSQSLCNRTELERFYKAGQAQTAVSRCGKTCPQTLKAVIAAKGTSTKH